MSDRQKVSRQRFFRTYSISVIVSNYRTSLRMVGDMCCLIHHVWLIIQIIYLTLSKLGKNTANDIFFFLIITKTRLYKADPLKPHFYIVKLGFTGVYIILLISAQKHRLWVLVRTASPRRFLRVPTIYVLSRHVKNIRIFI